MAALERSWQRFITGLVIFMAGVVMLMLLAERHRVLYYLSVAVLLCGFAIAMWGYWRIFITRFSAFKHIRPPADHRDD